MMAAAVFDMSISDGQWHWLVVEVTSSAVSLSLDNNLLMQK